MGSCLGFSLDLGRRRVTAVLAVVLVWVIINLLNLIFIICTIISGLSLATGAYLGRHRRLGGRCGFLRWSFVYTAACCWLLSRRSYNIALIKIHYPFVTSCTTVSLQVSVQNVNSTNLSGSRSGKHKSTVINSSTVNDSVVKELSTRVVIRFLIILQLFNVLKVSL